MLDLKQHSLTFIKNAAPAQCFFDFSMTLPAKTHTLEATVGISKNANMPTLKQHSLIFVKNVAPVQCFFDVSMTLPTKTTTF